MTLDKLSILYEILFLTFLTNKRYFLNDKINSK